MRPREIPREKEKLAVRCANQLFDDKKKKQIIIWPDPKLSHGYYSHYVTLTECCHFDD